jgi:predicted ATPase
MRRSYQIKGTYLLDELETALSPKNQLELLKIIEEKGISTNLTIIYFCFGNFGA